MHKHVSVHVCPCLLYNTISPYKFASVLLEIQIQILTRILWVVDRKCYGRNLLYSAQMQVRPDSWYSLFLQILPQIPCVGVFNSLAYPLIILWTLIEILKSVSVLFHLKILICLHLGWHSHFYKKFVIVPIFLPVLPTSLSWTWKSAWKSAWCRWISLKTIVCCTVDMETGGLSVHFVLPLFMYHNYMSSKQTVLIIRKSLRTQCLLGYKVKRNLRNA